MVLTALWGTVKKYGALRGRVAYLLKEQKRSCNEQSSLLIKDFKYGSSLSIFVQKNNEAQRSQVSQFLTLTNNTTAEFDSGISYHGIEGQNKRYSVFCDILGRKNIAGERSPKYLIAPKLLIKCFAEGTIKATLYYKFYYHREIL